MNAPQTIPSSDVVLPPGPKLFLIDARHRTERRYLRDWLQNSFGEEVREDRLITLPISAERERLRLDGLAQMLEAAPETLVVPVRVAWRVPNFERSRAIQLRHLLFGDPRLPNALRARYILWRDRKRAQCIVGKPATIGELRGRFREFGDENEASSEGFADFVVRQAGLVLDIVERGLRGSRYKVPRYVSAGVLADPKFRDSLRTISDKHSIAWPDAKAKAARYLKEMVARPTPLFIDLRARFERFLLGQGYDQEFVFDPQEMARLRRMMREKPTLLLFTHKTYLDGTTPTQLLYQQDLPMLHLFGGINLDFFAIGPLFRKSGTIFIRRSFQDNHIYKLALRHYIAYLFNKRFPMSWAFEGTRSRLGKLMPPKYGLLKYVMDAAFEENIRGVHIVPFVTSFDIIRDVEEYASEQTGRNKKPESFSWFIGYLRSLRAPLGRVYVDLGEPVVVDQAPHPDDRLALSKIAFEVAVQANRATPLTLTSLMCFALLGSAPRAMTASEMRATLGYLAHWAQERGIRISPDLDPQELAGIQTTVENLVHSKLLTRHDNGPDIVYAIAPEQHPIASYYRNSIIHHFLDKAIIELALFKARELVDGPAEKLFWDETERLRDLFKFEFFYPEKAVFRANIRSELARVDADWEAKLAGGGPLLKSLTNRFQPLCCQAVFLPFVEAYTIVLDILCRLQPGESIGKDRLVKQALVEGKQAYLLRRITSEASIGKILFENGFKMAVSQHLTGESSAETIAARKALRRKFRGLSRRMEKARIEVLALADKTFE